MSPPTLLAFLLLVGPSLFSNTAAVVASPLHDARTQPRLHSRDGTGNSSGVLSPTIWVPVMVVVLVVLAITIVAWSRGKSLLFWRRRTGATSTAATAAPSARELTAEQLAGSINNGGTPANSTTAGRTRRARRPRRTASQISTISLPAYNKEPGDEELVIFRGPQDMEDVTMPAATVMPAVDEDGDGSGESVHTGDRSQASQYTPMPTSPNSMPLLYSNDTSGDLSLQGLQPTEEEMPRRSYDTTHSSHETSSLRRMDTNSSENQRPDPRGDAPAYFEVVDQSVDDHVSPQNAETMGGYTASRPPSSPEQAPQRRSGFRSLLNRMSVGGYNHPSHARAESGGSMMSSNVSHGRGPSSSHRPSHSGSGSLMTSSMFRTLSRQKSTTTLNSNRLNSPSLISLNSISPPLTHTAVRTEFTYPKSGPTPEQLKLISSRESFARFGMPYGADAIAFAASASRQDLEPPPPDFDASASEINLPHSAGPSRLRSTSNAQEMLEDGNEDGATPPSSESNLLEVPATTSTDTVDSAVDAPSAETAVPTSSTHPSIVPSSPLIPKTLNVPSTFRAPSGLSVRSESRSSSFSVQSFETAAESIAPSAMTVLRNQLDSDGSQPSSPAVTPKLGGKHVLEPTDDAVILPAGTSATISA